MSGPVTIADLLPRPINAKPANVAAPPCPGCGCRFRLERLGVARCAYCGRPFHAEPTATNVQDREGSET